MDCRTFNVSLATFLIAAVALFGAWFAVDGLVHLDEFYAVAGPDAGVGRAALRHYAGVVSLHGGTLLGSIVLGSALLAVARARRARPLN